MARNNNVVENLVKRNTKLESFLKKVLPLSIFEKLRGYESCIVVSDKENKAFKYVVLGEEYLYLTENPPKSIQQAVWLGDLTSVDSVNDFPVFLSGEEKRNTQHIAVTYRTSSPVKQRSQRRNRKSALHGSSSDITERGERSNQSTPRNSFYNLDDSIVGSVHSLSLGYSNTNQNNSIPNIKDSLLGSKKKFSGDISDENVLKSLKEEIDLPIISDDDELQDSNSSQQLYKSFETTKFMNYSSNNSKAIDAQVLRENHDHVLPKSPIITQPKIQNSVISFNPNSDILTQKPQQSLLDKICCFCWKNESQKASPFKRGSKRNSIVPELKLNLPDIALSPNSDVQVTMTSSGKTTSLSSVTPSGKNTSLSSVSGMLTPRYFGNNSPMPLTQTSSRAPSILSRYNLSESRSTLVAPSLPDLTLNTTTDLPSDRRDTVINIYLLNLTSPLLMLIRSAWCNTLMRSTESLQSLQITQVKSTTSINRISEDRAFFESLMKYISSSDYNLGTTYSLFDQLKMAAVGSVAVKKTFLKNGQIFLFIVRRLQHYLPKSSCDLSDMDGLDARADELELVILLTDIISSMFSETEIYPFRVQALRADRGRCVLDLFMILMCQIDIPDSTKDMSDDYLQQIDELNKLVCTFNKSAVACVFELFLMAKQAFWNNNGDNFFNITWMIKVLEELKMTEKFIENLISDILRVIMPTQTPELEPKETVYFYKQLFIVLTFLENSRKVTGFIKATYREEFKYFIHSSTVTRKVPSRYPITFLIIQLIDRIKSKVLDIKSSMTTTR